MSMPLFIAIILVMSVLSLYLVARERAFRHVHVDDLLEKLAPINFDALENLMSNETTQFIQRHAPATQHRSLERERTAIAIEYVRGISKNAKLMARIGELASTSPDPAIANEGHELSTASLHLRLFTMRTLFRLYLRWMIPLFQDDFEPVSSSYRSVLAKASGFREK